jgi:outer membrane protein assembly factor BamB
MLRQEISLILALTFVLAACGDDLEKIGPTKDFRQTEELEEGGWPAFRYDPERTGYSPTATTGTEVSELWRMEDINTTDYGAAKSSPVVYQGTVYVGSDDGRFVAANADTGEVEWQTTIENTTQGIHGSPSIGPDGLVYVGAYNGEIFAFERDSGEEVWRNKLGFQIGASPVYVPSHGRVYCAHERSSSGGGFAAGYDVASGDKIWVREFRAHAHSSPAIDTEKNLLFVGDNLAIMHGYDLASGEEIWSHQLPQPGDSQSDIKSTPTVIADKNLVVFGAWSNKVHALDEDTGDQKWEFDAGAKVMSSVAYAPGREVVYVGTLGPTRSLYAIDVNTGEEVWQAGIGSSIISSPAVNADESLVVFGAYNGNLYALDADSGEVAWTHDIGSAVTGSPALVGSRVYVSAAKGDLVAIETRTSETESSEEQ